MPGPYCPISPTSYWTERVNVSNYDTATSYSAIVDGTGTFPLTSLLAVQGSLYGRLQYVGASGTPTQVQQNGVASNSGLSVTSFVINISASGSGNCIFVDFFCRTSASTPTFTVTDNKGQTYVSPPGNELGTNPSGGPYGAWYQYLFGNTASGVTTITVTVSSGNIKDYVVICEEWSGVTATTDPLLSGSQVYFLAANGSPANFSSTTAAVGSLLRVIGAGVAVVQIAPCTPAWLIIYEGGTLSPYTANTWTPHNVQFSEPCRFSWIVKQRGTAEVSIYVPASSNYLPTVGSPVCMWDQTATTNYEVFSGIIQNYEISWYGNAGDYTVKLTCVSLESVFDVIRVPALLFEDVTCGFIVSQLLGYAVGSPVGVGTINAGANVAQFLITDFPSLSDMFDKLATLSQYIWGVDPNTGTFYFRPPDTTASPFTLTPAQVQWESFTYKQELKDFRDRQILKVNSNAAVLSSELWAGAGQKTFPALRPIQQITGAWITHNVQNHATATLSGLPNPGDTFSITYAQTSGSGYTWTASHTYQTGEIIVDPGGFIQKATLAGGGTQSGTIQPTWIDIYGQQTTDNTMQWTNQGPAGFANGQLTTYTFVAALDNTQFGEILIAPNVATQVQWIADAINALPAQAGTEFSLATWENPLVNADTPAGASTVVVRNKAATASNIASLSRTGTAFSWSATQTSGGLTTFGTQEITYGIEGQTTGGSVFTVVFTPGASEFTSATPLNAGTSLQIQYIACNAGYIQVENTSLVTSLAFTTAGTGKFQQSSSDDNALSLVQGLSLAQEQLASYGVIPKTFKFETLQAGLYVGQVLTITMPLPVGIASLVNGTWFIQAIDAELIPAIPWMKGVAGAGHYRYTVTVINVNQIGSWIDFWEGLTGGGSGAASGAVFPGGGEQGVTANVFPLDFTGRTISGTAFTADVKFTYDLASFSNCTAHNCTFTGGHFNGATFTNADLTGSTLSGDFRNCDFSGSNLTNCTLSGDFQSCNFSSAIVENCTMSNSNFMASDFSYLTSAVAKGIQATASDFSGCNWNTAGGLSLGTLNACVFTAGYFLDAILDGATITASDFSGVQFLNTSANATNFTGSPHTGAPTSFVGCSFTNFDCQGTDFTGCNLAGTTWYQSGSAGGSAATFAGCNFTGANFCDLLTGNTGTETPVLAKSSNFTCLPWDTNKIIVVSEGSPATSVTITLPATATISDTWSIQLQNVGLGNFTLAPASGKTIDGSGASLSVPPGSGLQIFTDGTNFFSQRGISGGSGSGPLLQTNSVSNASQTALNLVAGTNVTLTNTSGGNVSIAAGASGASGTAVGNVNAPMIQSNTGWQNVTIWSRFCGPQMRSFPSSWVVKMQFLGGSPVIGAMVILTVPTTSNTVSSSTVVKIGGVANPTLTTPGLVTTDAIAIAMDISHDYVFAIFFANNGANSSVVVGQTAEATGFAAPNLSQYQSGNQTGMASIPTTYVQPVLILGPYYP